MPYKEGKKWRAVVTCCKKRYTASFPTKRAAQEWEIAKRKELEEQEKRDLSGPTLIELCEEYLKYATRFSKKTFDEKRTLCKRIILALGPDIPIESITPAQILQYLQEQKEKRSSNAYNKDRKNLMAMWRYAREILGIENDPLRGIKKVPHDRTPQYTPPQEDVLKVLSVATREERVMLDCYLQTAARRSEIFRWTWVNDINFERREVRLGTRKTRDGSMEYQWLPMSDTLYESLWWWWKNRPVKDSPYVFVVSNPSSPYYGQPYTTRRRFLPSLCKRAGVKPFGFHALRRYVASILADNYKVSAKTIQRILRHKSVTTTERYIQNINNDLRSIMDLLSQPNPKSAEEKCTLTIHANRKRS